VPFVRGDGVRHAADKQAGEAVLALVKHDKRDAVLLVGWDSPVKPTPALAPTVERSKAAVGVGPDTLDNTVGLVAGAADVARIPACNASDLPQCKYPPYRLTRPTHR
jgi:hypothetical protein